MATTSVDQITGYGETLAYKAPCRVATTANITLSGTQTIDGVAVVADDRVLVWNQTDTTENGIYVAASSAWRRSRDFDSYRDVTTGTKVSIVSGSYANREFVCTSTAPIAVGTDAIAFALVLEQNVPGFLNYLPLTITGNTTINNTDHKFRTLSSVPSANTVTVALTIPAASGLDTNFVAVIVNPTTNTGIRVTSSAGDFADYWVYTGQTSMVWRSGSTMYRSLPGRWQKGSTVQVYANSSTGSNNNDGLTVNRPVLTLNRAAQIIYHNCDHQGNLPEIHGTGTFVEGLSLTAYGQLTGASTMYIKGYNSTKFTWRATGNNQYCLQFGDNSIVIISYIAFDAESLTGCIAISGHQFGIIDIGAEVEFGAFPTGTHIDVDTDTKVNMNPPSDISGRAAYHTNQAGGSSILIAAGARDITNSPTFTLFHRVYGAGNQILYAGAIVDTGAVSGSKQYEITGPSMIGAGGYTIPGATPGTITASSGGIFIA